MVYDLGTLGLGGGDGLFGDSITSLQVLFLVF